jgi:hypothetical protein
MALLDQPLSHLGWEQMREVGWSDLIQHRLPPQVADLATHMSRRSSRRIRVFAMPTLAAGVAGVAVPFLHDDGILVDPSLLAQPDELTSVVAHELAYMLYPGWSDVSLGGEYDEMERFASMLAPVLLRDLPDKADDLDPMIEMALSDVVAA